MSTLDARPFGGPGGFGRDLAGEYLESTDLIKLGVDEEHGRVVVSTKNIQVGVTLMREKPVLVWEKDDWKAYLAKFKALPDAEQRGVLDMYYFPLDAPQVKQHEFNIFRCAEAVGVDRTLAMKLLSISLANSHAYYGSRAPLFQEVTSAFPMQLGPRQCALFLFASKVSHSCEPNTAYMSKTQDGKMEYHVVREIKEGELISIPYTCNVWETPTHLRRQELNETRSFHCKCKRCVQSDLLRLIKCSGCDGSALCTYDSSGEPSWSCKSCNAVTPRDQCKKTEEQFDLLVDRTEMSMIMRGIHSLPIRDVEASILEIERALHPLHFISLKARSLYVKLCASKAHDIEHNIDVVPPHIRSHMLRQFGNPKTLRSEAARMAMKNIRAIECVAASCSGWHADGIEHAHAAVYEASSTMFHCCQDLMGCPPSFWPGGTKEMVERYLPLMRLMFGQSDEDVDQIEKRIVRAADGHNDITSDFAQSFQASLNVSTDQPAKAPTAAKQTGKKNKKVGGSTKKKKKRGGK